MMNHRGKKLFPTEIKLPESSVYKRTKNILKDYLKEFKLEDGTLTKIGLKKAYSFSIYPRHSKINSDK